MKTKHVLSAVFAAIIFVFVMSFFLGEITEFLSTYWLNITVIGIILLTLIGTIHNSSGGSIPFYTRKIGKSFGICFNIYNNFVEVAKHWGMVLGFVNFYEDKSIVNGISVPIILGIFDNNSKINGINLGLFNFFYENSIVNGLNIGLINFNFCKETKGTVNGIDVGILYNDHSAAPKTKKRIVNGLQVSIFYNQCRTEKGLIQIGLFNQIELPDGTIRRSIIFNCAFPKS